MHSLLDCLGSSCMTLFSWAPFPPFSPNSGGRQGLGESRHSIQISHAPISLGVWTIWLPNRDRPTRQALSILTPEPSQVVQFRWASSKGQRSKATHPFGPPAPSGRLPGPPASRHPPRHGSLPVPSRPRQRRRCPVAPRAEGLALSYAIPKSKPRSALALAHALRPHGLPSLAQCPPPGPRDVAPSPQVDDRPHLLALRLQRPFTNRAKLGSVTAVVIGQGAHARGRDTPLPVRVASWEM